MRTELPAGSSRMVPVRSSNRTGPWIRAQMTLTAAEAVLHREGTVHAVDVEAREPLAQRVGEAAGEPVRAGAASDTGPCGLLGRLDRCDGSRRRDGRLGFGRQRGARGRRRRHGEHGSGEERKSRDRGRAAAADRLPRFEDHDEPPFELAMFDHGKRAREGVASRAQRLRDLQQVARVRGGTRAETDHRLVAGVLSREPGLALGDASQRMEPVERRRQPPCELPQPVSACHVDELVLHDQQAPLFVPAFAGARDEHGGARPAPGEGRFDLFGSEQAHAPRQVERA